METELTATIKNGLQKSVKEVLEHTDGIEKELNHLVIEENNVRRKLTQAEKDEVIKHLEEVSGDFIKKAGDNYGLYGGKILSQLEIDNWAKMIFKKYGTKLELVEDFGDPSILAQFDAVTNTIKHKKDITKYMLFHETAHAEECFSIGQLKYLEDAHIVNTPITDANLIRTYKREKYVYNKIIKHSKEQGFTFEEIDHAELYIEWLELKLKDRGIEIPK